MTQSEHTSSQTSLPTLFLAHGNPMNSIQPNPWADAWQALGAALPRPRAILMVSAHWYLPGIRVTAMPQPPTIHDFGGFPQALFEVRYPAPGSPALAARVQELLAPLPVALDQDWGLDHGTWAVLRHLFPQADIPVVQLSIDRTRPPAFHYQLGHMLAPLRDEGILLLGSGNIVHNLHRYAWGQPQRGAFDWAARFETRVRELLAAGDDAALVDFAALGPDAQLAIPTPEHYLPLLYVLGARRPGEQLSFPSEGFEGGSMSMLSLQIAAASAEPAAQARLKQGVTHA